MVRKPKASSESVVKEIEKVQEQFDAFDQGCKDLTLDRMNAAPKEESVPLEISQKDIYNSNDIYLKPKRSIFPSPEPKSGKIEKFNEKFRGEYEHKKQYVKFIAQNNEIGGEDIELWTRPYGGMPAEEWNVPVNKPVWGPRYLAEQIKRKCYHRLVMEETITSATGAGKFYGTMAADSTIQRLDAHPVNERKSIFMGSRAFG